MLNDSKCNLNVKMWETYTVKHNQPISNESLITANNGYGSNILCISSNFLRRNATLCNLASWLSFTFWMFSHLETLCVASSGIR